MHFRNGREAAKGDVSKMYNCVRLVEEDAFMQCFLWRNLDPNQSPQTYQVTVNNIGVKPAGAIATMALHKSSDICSNQFRLNNVHVVLMVSEQMQGVLTTLLENSSHVGKLFRVVAHIFKWSNLRNKSVTRTSPGCTTADEMGKSREFWLKFVQKDIQKELIKSVEHDELGKVRGQFKRLSVFKDDKGIWRVGMRLREYAPFTFDKQPPAFVPANSRFTLLLMEEAHRRKHSGVSETVA